MSREHIWVDVPNSGFPFSAKVCLSNRSTLMLKHCVASWIDCFQAISIMDLPVDISSLCIFTAVIVNVDMYGIMNRFKQGWHALQLFHSLLDLGLHSKPCMISMAFLAVVSCVSRHYAVFLQDKHGGAAGVKHIMDAVEDLCMRARSASHLRGDKIDSKTRVSHEG